MLLVFHSSQLVCSPKTAPVLVLHSETINGQLDGYYYYFCMGGHALKSQQKLCLKSLVQLSKFGHFDQLLHTLGCLNLGRQDLQFEFIFNSIQLHDYIQAAMLCRQYYDSKIILTTHCKGGLHCKGRFTYTHSLGLLGLQTSSLSVSLYLCAMCAMYGLYLQLIMKHFSSEQKTKQSLD